MKVLVTGGREFADWILLHASLKKLKVSSIGHGGARGADAMAGQYAEQGNIPVVVYPANWTEEGKRAGILRNIYMLKTYEPDIVVSFPGGKGTAHMTTLAKTGGYRVWQPALDHDLD